MPRLFECCRTCGDKRSATCHSTCKDYLRDRAMLDEINRKTRHDNDEVRAYVRDLIIKNQDCINFKARKHRTYPLDK